MTLFPPMRSMAPLPMSQRSPLKPAPAVRFGAWPQRLLIQENVMMVNARESFVEILARILEKSENKRLKDKPVTLVLPEAYTFDKTMDLAEGVAMARYGNPDRMVRVNLAPLNPGTVKITSQETAKLQWAHAQSIITSHPNHVVMLDNLNQAPPEVLNGFITLLGHPNHSDRTFII